MMKRFIALALCIGIGLFSVAELDATVWYVHPDSTLNSIQTALNLCLISDTVLVAPGTYYENLNWPNRQGIDLISESGPGTTIIDGGENGRVITISTGVFATTLINGFTIQNGVANEGSGIYCGGSPTITNNIISGNSATGWGGGGGGIWCYDSNPTITNNIISGNSATGLGGTCGGGIRCYGSSPTISGNIISDNSCSEEGGGIQCSHSSPTITGNTISSNYGGHGGGIEIHWASNPIIINNTITDNSSAHEGGGIYCSNNTSATIISNTIDSNSASYGGGIYCYNTSPIITGNTINGNSGTGGIHCHASSPPITGNTINGNSGDGIHCEWSSPTISHNTITENTDGICCGNGSFPLIDSNDIYYNIGYGLYNGDGSQLIDAEYNWWGDPSGPFHPDSNPGGLGDIVSDYVDFVPWLICPDAAVVVSVPDTTYSAPGDTITIPVNTEDLTGLGVLSAEFTLSYDSTIITGFDVDTSGTLLSGTDWTWEYNVTPGQLSVAMAGTDILAGGGTLINLIFVVSPSAQSGQESPLHFENFMFNDGIPLVATCDGVFIVRHNFGAIEGIVADASTGNFIENAIVTAQGTHTYCDTTDATGHYLIPEVLPDTYAMTVTAFGYNQFDTTGIVVVAEDTTEVNFALLHPEIVVEPASFDIELPVDTTYDTTMSISNPGNGPLIFVIEESMDGAERLFSINTEALKSTEHGESADGELYQVSKDGTKLARIPQADPHYNYSLHRDMFCEGFEGSWLPGGWSVIQINTDTTFPIPGWWSQTDYSMHSGNYAAGLWWSWEHQDEWLITPELTITEFTLLKFWVYGYQGSTLGDHYYVKVSTDSGITWDVVFDLSELSEGWNEWDFSYTIDLSQYSGQNVLLAWHAEDPSSGNGMWYIWIIDDIIVESSAPQWLTVEPYSGTVEPDCSLDVTLNFNTTNLVIDSTYNANLLIHNNSVDFLVTIPITMYVTSVSVEDDTPQVSNVFALNQNYPNPFSSSTTISFNLATKSHKNTPLDSKHLTGQARIRIYNVKGQLVKTLLPLTNYHSPITCVIWDGRDERGKSLQSGIYLYRITAGEFTDTKKCVILK